MTAWIWLLVITLGAAALGAFIYYGQRKTEEPEPISTEANRERATRKLYDRLDHERER